MNTPMRDDQLIFMISLPRSGSTLLQKILGGHKDIYTRSEPWLMLHPLYALKKEGIQARYSANLAVDGLNDFVMNLPGDGEVCYYSGLSRFYLSLYQPYLLQSGRKRFLDKTPRYYEVFDELQKTFPNAKYIILRRNPLAVLASILNTWVQGNYSSLRGYKCDLHQGASFLQRDFSGYKNTHVIKYESLTLAPELETQKLFDFLELPNQPDCIEYGANASEQWVYGDPKTVYQKSRPDPDLINAWHGQLSSGNDRKIISDYLEWLGKTGFEKMGYDFQAATDAISKSYESSPECERQSELSLSQLLLSENERYLDSQQKLQAIRREKNELQAKFEKKTRYFCQLESGIGMVNSAISEFKGCSLISSPLKKIRSIRKIMSGVKKIISDSQRVEPREP